MLHFVPGFLKYQVSTEKVFIFSTQLKYPEEATVTKNSFMWAGFWCTRKWNVGLFKWRKEQQTLRHRHCLSIPLVVLEWTQATHHFDFTIFRLQWSEGNNEMTAWIRLCVVKMRIKNYNPYKCIRGSKRSVSVQCLCVSQTQAEDYMRVQLLVIPRVFCI